MQILNKRTCIPCEDDSIKKLDFKFIEEYLEEVPSWTLSNDGLSITRDFSFKDFKQALSFVNKVGELAEIEGHHPDVYLFYGKVTLTLSTHNVGGLTVNDFILASKIDGLVEM